MTHDKRDWYQVSLKLILKNKKGEVLVLKTLETGNFAGYHDLPGGRIDTDEFVVSFNNILKREVKEEVGDIDFGMHPIPIAVARANFASKDKDIRILYLFFEANYIDGNVTISNEHADYLWVDLNIINPTTYFLPGIREGIEMYMKK
ncbi:MAG: NUDIX domain-containing protein [Patescibacteria group bacterium]